MSRPPGPTDPTKVVGRRVIAYMIDLAIVYAVTAGAFLAMANLTQYEGATDCAGYETGKLGCFYAEVNGKSNVFVFENRALLIASLVGVAYSVLFVWLVQGVAGWTPGKLLTGIRVVDEQGKGPGLGRSLIRWLLMIVDGLLGGLVGLITMLVSKGHRRVGDMAAKTFVVKRRSRGAPIVVPGMTGGATPPQTIPPDYTAQMPATPPVAAPPAPPPTTPPPQEMATPPTGTPVVAGPQWDPQRNAYIQWDESRRTWLTFDDATKEWKPLS